MKSATDREPSPGSPRVVVLGENASMKMGGEASFPYLFFKLLRDRGVEAWLVAHARTRDELHRLLPDEVDRMHFVEESRLDVFLWKLGLRLPRKIDEQTIGMLRHILTHRRLRRVVAEVVARERADIVHEVDADLPQGPQRDVRPGRAGRRRPAVGGDGLPPGVPAPAKPGRPAGRAGRPSCVAPGQPDRPRPDQGRVAGGRQRADPQGPPQGLQGEGLRGDQRGER